MSLKDQGKKQRVLLLYRKLAPTVNLCGLVQFQWLFEQNHIDFRHISIHRVRSEDLLWADIVVLVRGEGVLDAWIAKTCQNCGKRTAYVLDDDLLNIPKNLKSGSFYAQKSVKRHIQKTMLHSDYLISPSKKLISQYGNLFKSSFLIVEPSLYRACSKKSINEVIRIGFAGSPDRAEDIDVLLDRALREICKKYGEKVRLEFFGSETKLAKELCCITHPYINSYEAYQKKMVELNWDIGLAPMPDTQFHSCKHYNKLVEYCGFGIVGIYSNVLPYTDGVEHRITGLLCNNTTEAWVNALSELIEDDSLRSKMSQVCIDRAQTVFSVETSSKELFSYISGIEKCSGDSGGHTHLLLFVKQYDRVTRLVNKCKAYGWKLPVVLIKKIVAVMRG